MVVIVVEIAVVAAVIELLLSLIKNVASLFDSTAVRCICSCKKSFIIFAVYVNVCEYVSFACICECCTLYICVCKCVFISKYIYKTFRI